MNKTRFDDMVIKFNSVRITGLTASLGEESEDEG